MSDSISLLPSIALPVDVFSNRLNRTIDSERELNVMPFDTVEISKEGLALLEHENLHSIVKERDAPLPLESLVSMSYEELLLERGKNAISLDGKIPDPFSVRGDRNSPAANEIDRIVHTQNMHASKILKSVYELGEEFDELLQNEYPNLELSGLYDLSMDKNGDVVVVSDSLNSSVLKKVQEFLDGDNEAGSELKSTIKNYADEAVKLGNYIIKDRGHPRVSGDGNRLERRTEELTLAEFGQDRGFLSDAQKNAPFKLPVNAPEGLKVREQAPVPAIQFLLKYQFVEDKVL